MGSTLLIEPFTGAELRPLGAFASPSPRPQSEFTFESVDAQRRARLAPSTHPTQTLAPEALPKLQRLAQINRVGKQLGVAAIFVPVTGMLTGLLAGPAAQIAGASCLLVGATLQYLTLRQAAREFPEYAPLQRQFHGNRTVLAMLALCAATSLVIGAFALAGAVLPSYALGIFVGLVGVMVCRP